MERLPVSAVIPRRVAYRLEPTGTAAGDRTQRLAQQVGQAHEATRSVVEAISNTVASSLATDTTIAAAAYATVLSSSITTTLQTGSIDISVSAGGTKTTAAGNVLFQVLVDGTVYGLGRTSAGLGLAFSLHASRRISVSRGPHTVVLQWQTGANSAQVNASSVATEHIRMIITEVP